MSDDDPKRIWACVSKNTKSGVFTLLGYATFPVDGWPEYVRADRIKALEGKLAKAGWLLTDAAVQLEEGKIKTRRNRAALIWKFLEEIKAT